MDDKDIELLRYLQDNGRAKLNDISKASKLATTTAHKRIKKLEKDGIIKGYAAIIDAEKVGKPLLAYIMIRTSMQNKEENDRNPQKTLCKSLAKLPFVQSAHVISGEWDVLLKVRARDMKELNDFIVKELRLNPVVDRTMTFFVMEDFKDTLSFL